MTSVNIEDIKLLSKSCVHMKDSAHVEKVLHQLIQGGPSRLQVISDFDMTITKQHLHGICCQTSFGIFGECKQLPSSYSVMSKKLYQHYRPIEIDPKMSKEKKIPYMVEWYKKALDLLTGFEFKVEEIDEVVKKANIELRDGTDTMFKKLQDADVPILVFSAGLGDVVNSVLKHFGVLHPNVKIISNFLQIKNSQIDGFQNTMIHSLNKNEHVIENSDYFEYLTGRNNIILLGDAVGDAHMADGVQNINVVLKIGYLYDNVDRCLELYQKHFDIVLVNDQTMDVANEILKLII